MTDAGPGRVRVVVGSHAGARAAAVRRLAHGPLHEITTAASWAFVRSPLPSAAPGAATLWLRDLHLAFPAGQTAGTRLVLTQSTYQLQRWLDWAAAHPDASILADADRAALTRHTPEAFAGRGPWARIERIDIAGEGDAASAEARSSPAREAWATGLVAAFNQPDPAARLAGCRHAAATAPHDAAAQLAWASACMEARQLDDAGAALARAQAIAPDWEAVHFELGKLRLRLEDTAGAAAAFAEAAHLMPTFATAHANLGAALGELDRGGDALPALERALALDPRGYPILNSIGAVHREAGRLDQAEAVFREVIALAPGFVFGRYNLAHTLFLQGRFDAARDAYEDAFGRDPQRNPRQACRLAVARAAAGDPAGALTLLDAVVEGVGPDRVGDILGEAETTLVALSALPGIDAGALARVLASVRRYSS